MSSVSVSLASRPLTHHTTHFVKQSSRYLNISLAQPQICPVIPGDQEHSVSWKPFGYFRNVSGLFSSPRNAANWDWSWSWRNDSYWYHMRFWSCSQFKGVIKVSISKYWVLWWGLRFCDKLWTFLLEKINSYGGISLVFLTGRFLLLSPELSYCKSVLGTLSFHSDCIQ